MQWAEFSSSLKQLSDDDRAAVRRAFDLGERAHAHQRRQSGEPYFSHPIAVARMLADMGGDRDTIVAGLLHDTVEDTELSLDEIARSFGQPVATLIDGVTKLEHADVAHKPRFDEKIETLRKMFTLMQQDVRIMVIKLADRLHNMQTLEHVSLERQIRVARETMDVYVKIADRLGMRDMRAELEALSLAILEPDLYAQLVELRRSKEQKGKTVLEAVRLQLEKTHPQAVRGVEMRYEHKTWSRLHEVLKTPHGATITGIATVAVSFVCEDVDRCYALLGAIHQEWQREVLSFQDFINSPMINGYRALHTTVILGDGTRVRCKMRTKDMEAYAHRGITVSCFDAKAHGLLEHLPWTSRIATISSDTSNESAEFWEGLQNDILGATIMVHGPDDNTVMVPRNATALDGAFYLFGKTALRTKTLRMNGRECGFDEPLENASTLFAEFHENPQANLGWLHAVNTAVSSAIIRAHLAAAPEKEKIMVGRELLDISLQRTARLKLGEISPSLLDSRARVFGAATFDDLLELIAEGKLDAGDVAMKLFAQRVRRLRRPSDLWVLRAEVPHVLEEQIFRLAKEYPRASVTYERIDGSSNFTIRFRMSGDQAHELETMLHALLPPDGWKLQRMGESRAIVGLGVAIVMLWGLDPVFARLLLQGPVDAFDLAFVRAIVFFLASSVLYGAQLLLFGRTLKWLSPLNPTLIFAGAALFATGFLTYVGLAGVSASLYILLVVAAMLLTVMLHQRFHAQPWLRTAVSLFTIVVTAFVAARILGFTTISLLGGIGSALGFSLYSEFSRRYQQKEAAIRARYPAFLFWLSSVGFVLAGFIVPFTDFHAIPTADIAYAVAYVLVFSVLPYSLYFEITRRVDSSLVDRSSPYITIVTVAGEFVALQSGYPLLLLPLLVVFVWYYQRSLRMEGRSANVLWRPPYAVQPVLRAEMQTL